MALTAIRIKTDKPEYSRFEADKSIIRAKIFPDPATELVDEPVTVTISKGAREIARQEVTLSGDYPKGSLVEFDLNSIADTDGIPLCTRGQYTIRATQNTVTASAIFRVSVVTVAQMKAGYCFGTPLYVYDKMAPKKQPSLVTGVTIRNVSEKTKQGMYNLTYTKATNSLTWGGGAEIPIGSASEIVPDAKGNYIEVDIDEFELPDTDAAEAILVDREVMSDDVIRDEIDKAISEIESSLLKVWIEPTRFATEPYFSEGEYDKKIDPLAYYENDFTQNAKVWHLNLPIQQLIKVDEVSGYIGNTQAIRLSNMAYSCNRKAGTLDVLPFNSQYSYLYTFFVQLSFWGYRSTIAGFWRFKGVAGIERMEGDIVKLIGMSAAIPILTMAGQGYRAGYSSESISKDGVSSSRSYTSSASYGIYSATIEEYRKWIKDNTRRLRNTYRGIPMVTI